MERYYNRSNRREEITNEEYIAWLSRRYRHEIAKIASNEVDAFTKLKACGLKSKDLVNVYIDDWLLNRASEKAKKCFNWFMTKKIY